MKTRILVVFLVSFSLLAFGCAKKKTTGEPMDSAKTGTEAAAPAKPAGPSEADLTKGPSQAELAAMKSAKEKLMSEMVHFDFDKYNIKPEYKDEMKAKAEIMKAYAKWNIVIEGHCDERGTEEYNLALGDRRARAAHEMLVLLGVSPARMKTVSFGEERPIGGGHNEKAWALDRRDEFKVIE